MADSEPTSHYIAAAFIAGIAVGGFAVFSMIFLGGAS